MNGRLVPVVARELLPMVLALAGLVIPTATGQGARTNDARITRVSNEVKLLSATGGSRSASVNDRVSEGTEVVTGPDGQTELTFADQTLARLGGKTTFGFTQGVRQMELRSGAMLVRAPASARGAEIRAAAATVEVTGTTCLLENNAGRYLKLVVLDGTARMFLRGRLGESVLVKEGQLLMFHLGPKADLIAQPGRCRHQTSDGDVETRPRFRPHRERVVDRSGHRRPEETKDRRRPGRDQSGDLWPRDGGLVSRSRNRSDPAAFPERERAATACWTVGSGKFSRRSDPSLRANAAKTIIIDVPPHLG